MRWTLLIKDLLGTAANAVNVLNAIDAFASTSLIFGYHRVLPSDSGDLSFCPPGMYVTPETLRRHLVFLAKHFELVHLDDMIDNNLSKRCCAITFDDGWWDNFAYAFPVLEELKVPATIFLTTDFVTSRQWPWPDRLAFYAYSWGTDHLVSIIGEHSCFSKEGSVPSSIGELIALLKGRSHHEITEIMDRLDERFSSSYGSLHKVNPALTWADVRKMRSSTVRFGLHSHTHVIANAATPASFLAKDYATSAAMFVAELGEAPRTFGLGRSPIPMVISLTMQSGY
jgi:hypothetical protein